MTLQESRKEKIAFTQACKASERREGVLIYRASKDGVIICGCDPACSGELVIPETLGGQTVYGIKDAFQDCKNLQSLVIPACVAHVSGGIFGFCISLEAFEVSKGNPYLCSHDGVLFSKDMRQLLQYPQAKSGSYRVPNGITTIRTMAFECCHGLTAITLPDDTTTIGSSAFAHCVYLEHVTLSSHLEEIDYGLFSHCLALAKIKLPDAISTIKNGAFSSCTSLTDVVLPAHLRRIGLNAFAGCTSLEEVAIPKDTDDIGPGAFSECTSLKTIDVDLCNPTFRSVNGVLFDSANEELVQYPAGRSGAYTIPEGTLSISELAFCGCVHLSEIHLPDSVHQISQQAFAKCAGLKSVSLPYSLQAINEETFIYCTNLCEVRVPPNVVAVNHLAFGGCTKLKRIIFEGNAPDIMKEAFTSIEHATIYHHEGMNRWENLPEGLKSVTIRTAFSPKSDCQ